MVISERLGVFINPKTGKSKQLPLDEKTLLKNFETKKTTLRINLPAPPQNKYYKYILKVHASDIDHLYHVNNSVWMRYCMDAAAEAVQNGFFKCFKRDLFSYPVKKLDCIFNSEALAGDELTVLCWQEPSLKLEDTIFFHVAKGSKDCMSCSIQFYMQHVLSKL